MAALVSSAETNNTLVLLKQETVDLSHHKLYAHSCES
jgi:hypothetical protein